MLFKMGGIRKRLISVLIQEFRHNYLFKVTLKTNFARAVRVNILRVSKVSLENNLYFHVIRMNLSCFWILLGRG